MYADVWAPFLCRGHNAVALVAVLGALALCFGVEALRLQPAQKDVDVWPAWHNVARYLDLRDTRFELKKQQLHLLWGVKGVDRSSCAWFVEEDLGEILWDDEFDASDPQAQLALLRGCGAPVARPELRVVPGTTKCVVGEFAAWAGAQRNATLPLPRASFEALLRDFLAAHQEWLQYVSVVGDAQSGYRLRHVVASFTVRVENHAPASRRLPLYRAWEAEVASLNAAAPPSANKALQTAEDYWVMMAVQQLLFFYCVTLIFCSAAVGFCFILVATRSPRAAALCTLSILAVVSCFTGLMVGCFDMRLGMVESVVLMVSVGLMLDPLAHFAHAFTAAPGDRAARLTAALTQIGISVLAAALSTAGSCAVLFLCVVTVLSQFGMLLCMLLLVTLIYANAFLAPLLFLCGPTDPTPASPLPDTGVAEHGARPTTVAAEPPGSSRRWRAALPQLLTQLRAWLPSRLFRPLKEESDGAASQAAAANTPSLSDARADGRGGGRAGAKLARAKLKAASGVQEVQLEQPELSSDDQRV